jgi:RNA polymerase sigma-70 factor (ECF subfamily)
VSRKFISFQSGQRSIASYVKRKLYSNHYQAEDNLELFAFDKSYVDRLRDGEPSTEQHFVAYFGQILGIMLRSRYLPPERVEDVRQETFARVIATLRRDGGIRQPERFGAFVNSICKNVLRENNRQLYRTRALPPDQMESPNPDTIVDLEQELISQETKEKVRRILAEMKPRDRELLRALFLEEKDKDQICREFGVEREYLRVLLYRAKVRFRATFDQQPENPLARTTRGGVP